MILVGDTTKLLHIIPERSVQCVVTSPPYWGLRDYGIEDQLGMERTPTEYVEKMVDVFRQVKRILKDDGTLWLNLGDSYASGAKNRTPEQASRRSNLRGGFWTQEQSLKQQSKIVDGLKPKDLAGIPWAVAFALRNDGWYLRQDIIWHKPNPMPESTAAESRCTKSHEYIFLLSKSEDYYFDFKAIEEPAVFPNGPNNKGPHKKFENPNVSREYVRTRGNVHKIGPRETRRKRSVWSVCTQPFKGAHFATFPPKLIEPCILAGSKIGDTVLDPFFGAGTVGVVAKKLNRKYIGIELNPDYAKIAKQRIERV